MSFEAMTWASKCKTGSPTRKLILLLLADRTNGDTGVCFPSLHRISEDCELSKSAVKKHLKALEDAGFVEIIRRKDATTNLSNVYRLDINGHSGSRDDPRGGSRDDPRGGSRGDLGVGHEVTPNQEDESGSKYIAFPEGKDRETATKKDTVSNGFDAIWAVHPKKVGKQSALKAFNRLSKRGDLPDVSELISALERHIQAKGWTSKGQYTPHLSTWLNGMRWEDEVEIDTEKIKDTAGHVVEVPKHRGVRLVQNHLGEYVEVPRT